MTDIAQKLRALADEIEAKPQSEPKTAQPWPPKGVAIEISTIGGWVLRVSAGGGWFYSLHGERARLDYDRWRYAPAPWDIAPEWAKCWIVTSRGESLWCYNPKRLSDVWFGEGAIVHVEYRLSEAFPKEDKGETEG